ncbi:MULTISPECIES: response regulator [unclassified Hydrogenophaga]|uniref:response regulator n=1 Tax=unclassified Hydrogenophaga TaxID=2610897 RepID=UPI00138F6984|nr:response regulator [Hydrogenophaga sp. Root209]
MSSPPSLSSLQPPGSGPLRVLIADDHVDAVETLAMLVSLEGHAVEVARNGEEALELVARFHPDVSILDIGMPGLDGHAVAHRIRQTPQGAHMLIVALTGRSEAEDKLRARASGFDEHFTKPVDPARLLQRIAAWHHGRASS